MKKTFKFLVGISVKSYDHKPTVPDTQRMFFKRRVITAQELCDYLMDGHTMSPIFQGKQRRIEDWIQSNVIGIDIDDSPYPMNEFVSSIRIKPTFYHTTSSNAVDDYHFRLVYVFDDAITEIDTFKNLYNALKLVIEKDTIAIKDNCGGQVNRLFYGNSLPNHELVNNNKIYNAETIFNYCNRNGIDYIVTTDKKKSSQSEKGQCNKNLDELLNEYKVNDSEFFKYYDEHTFEETYEKYGDKYKYFDKTKFILDENKAYTLRNNYYAIVRSRSAFSGRLIKLKDGNRRRLKLFLEGLMLRKIKSDITLPHMLTILCFDMGYYIDNSVDAITKRQLLGIALNAMTTDMEKYNDGIEEYKNRTKGLKERFIVNTKYCNENGINVNSMKTLIKSMLNLKQAIEKYDTTISYKENNARFKQEYGVNYLKSLFNKLGISKEMIKENKFNLIESFNEYVDIKSYECGVSFYDIKFIVISQYKTDLNENDNMIVNEEKSLEIGLKQQIEVYSSNNTLFNTFTYFYGEITEYNDWIQLKEFVEKIDNPVKNLWISMIDEQISNSYSVSAAS